MVIRLERVPAPTVAAGTAAVRSGGRRRRRVAIVGALVAILVATGASLTAWALIAPPGAVGHDVSYPQCGTALPTSGTFGVVGVNGGKVSTTNPCLSSQYAWAAKTSSGAALYANTGNPGSISTFYWPASGSRDPALCTDRSSASDPGCAYDYGWHGAKNSLQIAQNAVSGASGRTWWLDVELANSWNGSPTANAAALQGALDGMHDAGVGTVGLYSTAYQWSQITGGYSSGNAATYRSAWAASFTPKHPMEQAPLWVAGLSTLDAASRNCSTSFTGGTTALAQYTDGATDGDLICGGAPTPPTTTPTTTSAPTTGSSATTSTSPATSVSPTTGPSSTTSAAPTTTTAARPPRPRRPPPRRRPRRRRRPPPRPSPSRPRRPGHPHRGRRQRLGRAQLDGARRGPARVDLQRHCAPTPPRRRPPSSRRA